MIRRSTSRVLLGLGALVLAGCSTTAMSSPPESTEAPVSLLATESTGSTEVPETTEPAPETTAAPPGTTEAPETTEPAPETTEAPPETTTPETTTTVPSNIIAVAPLAPPLEVLGSSSGDEAARLQERLLELGFWLDGVDGNYGLTTRQAVMAFQKYQGLPADGVVDPDTAHFITHATERPRGRSDAGTLIEVDKSKQLLFVVVDGVTEWILNTSTGTEIPYERPNSNDPEIIERGTSVTPVGLYRVDRERPEGWWEGDLGEIYRPKYFIGGVAVHGSNSIPDHPASHGCVRVSVPAMDWIWDNDIMPMRSPVWVHGEIPT